jgi:hypothetical protein
MQTRRLYRTDNKTSSGGNNSDEDGDDEIYIDTNYWLDCTGSYTTLQQLEVRKDSIPAHCMGQYILDVQVAVFDASLSKYKDLIDDGYDKKFQIYEKYAKAQIPDQLDIFMASDKVDKYYKCYEVKHGACCDSCPKKSLSGPMREGFIV